MRPRDDAWSHKAKLTRKEHDVLVEYGKVASQWEYETYSGKWHIDLYWYGYRVRMTYVDQKMEWWAFRDCYMKKECERLLRKEKSVEEIREMANIGRWTMDLDSGTTIMEDAQYEKG